jgi:hypothetical protein
MITADQIRQAVPITAWLEKHGVAVVRKGKEATCLCPFHADKHPSMRINEEKGLWFCDPCGIGGSVIDLEFRTSGKKVKEAMRTLAMEAGLIDEKTEKPEKSATYTYRDALGRDVMYVDRTERLGLDKKFSQWRKDASGKRIDTITGIDRVLYRMEEWHAKAEVALCEGEKCADAMRFLGYDATTNPGGSNGWLDAFAVFLADKHVDIWPDNDLAGNKWLAAVLKSLEGKVASLRVLRVPEPYADLADVVLAQGKEIAAKTIIACMGKVDRVPRGVVLPILSAAECLELYRRRVLASDDEGIDLSRWLPSLRSCARPLLPGDMAVILSDTGVGKTTILANIADSQRPKTTLMFELELSAEAMCERFIAMTTRTPTLHVETETRQGRTFDVSRWSHVWICPDSKVTLEQMESLITRCELRTQSKPRLVLIDYIGLMGGGTGKRYERLSTIAEGLKILAKSTNTVIIVASQIRRREDSGGEVGLHDAKDSGSIENSAQLVISATRPTIDTINLTILKQTKRAGRVEIQCNFNGDMQRISELTGEEER